MTFTGMVWAEWEQIPGMEGGRIRSLTSLGNTLFAGTGSGGVFRSIDSGSSWIPVNTGFNANPYNGGFNIASLAVAGDTILAGTGDGLYESANRGDTWVRNWRMNQADLETFNAILVNGEFIFGATDHDRLYRYSRSQSKWEAGGPSESLKCLALAHGYLYGGTMRPYLGGPPRGVVRGTESAGSWKFFQNDLSASAVNSLAADGASLFAATAKGLFRSMDSGSTWQKADNGLTDTVILCLLNNNGVLFAGTLSKGVFRSDDHGATWQSRNVGMACPVIRCLYAMGGMLFAGTDPGGVYRSRDNGATWARGTKGMSNLSISKLLFAGGNRYAAIDGGEVYRSSGADSDWTPIGTGLPFLGVKDLAYGRGKLYASLWDATGVFRLDSADGTWVQVGTSSLKYTNKLATIGAVLISASDGSGLFRSTDDGATWSKASPAPYAGRTLLSKDSLLFAAGSDGVTRSGDSGKTWTKVNGGLQLNPNSGSYQSALSLADLGSDIYLEMMYTTYRSSDLGDTWTKMDMGTKGDLNSFAGLGGFLYYGSYSGGVYRLSGDGKTRQSFSPDLPRIVANDFAQDSEYLYIGTEGSGIWRRRLSELVPVSLRGKVGTRLESRIALGNPILRHGEFLEVAIPAQGRTRLALFDVDGKKAATLLDQSMPPGIHRFRFDRAGLSAGMYFLNLRAAGEVHTQRVILIE